MRYRHLFRKQKDTGWIPARDTRIPGFALGWASGIKLYQINLVHPPLVRREQSEVASVLKPMYNQIIYVIHSVKYLEKKAPNVWSYANFVSFDTKNLQLQ